MRLDSSEAFLTALLSPRVQERLATQSSVVAQLTRLATLGGGTSIMGKGSLEIELETLQSQLNELQAALGLEQEPPVQEALGELASALAKARTTAQDQSARYIIADPDGDLFAQAFEAFPHGCLITTPKGIIRRANHTAAEMLRLSVDTLKRKSIASFAVRKERRAFRARLDELRDDDRLTGWEVQIQPAEGASFPAVVSVSSLCDSRGEVLARHWMIRDVTQRRRIEGMLRRHAEERDALQQTVLDIAVTRDQEELLDTIVRRAVALLGATNGGMYLCDPIRKEMRCVVSYNTLTDYRGVVLQYGEGAAGTVAQTGEPLIIDDYRSWEGRATAFEDERPFVAVLSAPMIWQGQVTGVIHVLRDGEEEPFTAEDLDLLSAFAAHAAVAVENARLYREGQRELEERKAAEKALRESEHYLVEAQAIAGLGHWKLDPETQQMEGSAALFRIFGLTQEGANLDGFLNAVHPEDREYDLDHIKRGMEHGEPWDIEHRLLLEDGTLKHVHSKGEAIPDKTGRPELLIGTVQDITARKLAEETLRQQRDRAQAYLDVAGVMFVAIDAEGQITLMNQKGCEILGYAQEEIVGRNWFETFLQHDERESVAQVFQRLMNGEIEPVEYYENAVLTREGDVRLIAWHNTVLKDQDDNIVGTLSSGEDITERRQAEDALRERESRLRQIVAGTPAGYFFIDREGKFVDVNEAWLRMHGYSTADEVIGQHFSLTQADPAMEEAQAIVQTLLEGESIPSGEFTRRCRDGSVGHHYFSATPVSAGGEVVGLEGFIIDTTERKRAEEQLRASLREKEVLLREVHHRVKNNLQLMYSLLDLQMDFLHDSQAVQAFRDSQSRINTMALVYERLYQSPYLAEINLGEYIENVVQQTLSIHSPQADRARVTIAVDSASLDIDETICCGLIVTELVSNALTHAFADGRDGEVQVELRVLNEDRLCLEVRDNRVGLPPDLEIDDPFSLGLQLVNMLVGQLRGVLEIDGSNGSRFRITFTG